jgi:hypothetical protein
MNKPGSENALIAARLGAAGHAPVRLAKKGHIAMYR